MNFITLKNADQVTLVKDVVIHPYIVNQDSSGILVETLRKDWKDVYSEDINFSMQYYSETPSGMARDEDVWHYHPTIQDDRFSVIKGEIVVAVADTREESSTRGLLNLFYINARKDPYLLLIPRKTLHGFLVVSPEPAILINFPTGLYNVKEDERIPYEQAGVVTTDGKIFSWDLVKNEFPNLASA